MGNFYVNLTVRATNREEIGNLLAGRDALISPVLEGGVVVVYDKEADLQYWPLIEPVVQSLSEKLATVVLTVINHDDGMLAYVLYERGKHVDTYNSAPDYFEATSDKRGPIGGDPALLCNAFGSRSVEAVKAVLQKPGGEADDGYRFAYRRHRDLMEALGLASQAFFVGYNYLEAGEIPPDMNKTDFIEIGGKP